MALARRSLFGLLAGLPFVGAAKARPYAGDRIAPGAVWSIGERGPEMFVPRFHSARIGGHVFVGSEDFVKRNISEMKPTEGIRLLYDERKFIFSEMCGWMDPAEYLERQTAADREGFSLPKVGDTVNFHGRQMEVEAVLQSPTDHALDASDTDPPEAIDDRAMAWEG